VQRQTLTPGQKRRLQRAEARIARAEDDLREARGAWVVVVQELGQAACARELNITPQAVFDRLKSWGRFS